MRNLIDRQLKQAFRLARDLAKDAVFTKKEVSGFNFGIGEVITTPDRLVPAKVIETEASKKKNTLSKTLMVQSSEIGSLNDYAAVRLDGEEWSFGAPIKDSGFILLITVFREV